MNQSIWGVVALGVGVAMIPLILPSSGGGGTGSEIFELLTALTPILGVVFAAAVFGLLIVLLGFDRGI
mgnify:CR=1 FL=1